MNGRIGALIGIIMGILLIICLIYFTEITIIISFLLIIIFSFGFIGYLIGDG